MIEGAETGAVQVVIFYRIVGDRTGSRKGAVPAVVIFRNTLIKIAIKRDSQNQLACWNSCIQVRGYPLKYTVFILGAVF